MRIQDVYDLVTKHTVDGTLTLPATALGNGTATSLVSRWFGGTLTMTGASCRITSSEVLVDGTVSWLGLSARRVTGATLSVDTATGLPSLFLPLTVGDDWTFATSFAETNGTPLAELKFRSAPQFFLTSVERAEENGRPRLPVGLTFHAAAAELPAWLEWLGDFLPIKDNTLSLTGPVRQPHVEAKHDIQLSSALVRNDELHAGFHLLAGSRQQDGEVVYGLRLGAEVRFSDAVGVVISAPVRKDTSEEIVLSADALPEQEVGLHDVQVLPGVGDAVRELGGNGFSLGRDVRLTELSMTVKRSGRPRGLAEAVMKITAAVRAKPDVAWKVAGDAVAINDVGAILEVTAPLTGERRATVEGHGAFTVATSVHLCATAAIPPGEFTLELAQGTTAEVVDVLHRFLPSTDLSGVPRITLHEFTGKVTPKQGEYSVAAAVQSSEPFDLGTVQVTLTTARLELRHSKGEDGGKGVTTAELSAKASLMPAKGGKPIVLEADWSIPGKFALTGELPDFELVELLNKLAVLGEVRLPGGLPRIELHKTKATLQVGQGYEVALSTEATFDGTTLGLTGKLAKADSKTAFVAALWRKDWTWSPKDISGWGEYLGVLDGLSFTKSGLAVSTADGQAVQGGVQAPDTLPRKLGKGLTFFTEAVFEGVLYTIMNGLFGATSVRLTALLAAEIKDSEFTALLAEGDTGKGFGNLELKIVPLRMRVELDTTFVLTIPAIGSFEAFKLQLTARGGVAKEDAGWSLNLVLILSPPADETVESGALQPHQTALSLEGAGLALLTAVPEPAGEGRPGQPDSTTTKRMWRNAFGLKGFDIEEFFLEIKYQTPAFVLGGGGTVRIGGLELGLAVYGTYEGEPSITAFHFKAEADKVQGVSLYDVVNVVVTPPDALDFLKQVVLRELEVCVALLPGGWTDPITEKVWKQGFYARGDITLVGNRWRFDVRVGKSGLYAKSDVEKPIEIGNGALKLSDAGGTRGPQLLFDTGDVTGGEVAQKVLALSGGVELLGRSAKLDAEFGKNGFKFFFDVDLDVFKATVECVLNEHSLVGKADVKLAFDVPAPAGTDLAGKPLHIRAQGSLGLAVGAQGAAISLNAQADIQAAGNTVERTALKLDYSISTWEDVVKHLVDNPALVLGQLGEDVWKTAKGCAVNTASALM